jgi:thiol-disulfide isomerase/thioredoxin
MNFKKISYFTILFLLLILLGCTHKSEPTFSISGTVLNTESNKIIVLKVEDIIGNQTTVIDTLTIDKNGNFNGDFYLEPNIYQLIFDDKKTVQLAINTGQQITIVGNNLDSLTTKGSVDTDLLNSYETFRKTSLKRLVTKVRDSIKKLENSNTSAEIISELRILEVENYNIHLFELTNFIKQHMGSSIAIYPTSIRWNGENLAILEPIVANFKINNPSKNILEKLENRIEVLKKMTIGSFVSNIEMPSQTKAIISLNNVKGNITLIDFWASWCPPCRSESVLLNQIYSEYQAKGFEIYSISLDTKEQRWLNAIEKDKRSNWINVSTLNGFDSFIAKEYGITALPTNFVIDENGKIIAVNIHGEALKTFIENLNF